ncbi:hypothetical protein AB4Z54_36385, partial [Streptomyces sp. MCAF7]
PRDNAGQLGKWDETMWEAPSDSAGQPDAPATGRASSTQSGSPTVEDSGPEDPLLSPKTLMRDAAGAVRGRNWTSETVERLVTGTIRVYEQRPGLPPKRVSKGVQERAPWPEDTYVVGGESDGQAVTFEGRTLNAYQVADKLAADPELAKLPRNVPVALAIPYAGAGYQEFLKIVAARLGRTVWGPSDLGRLQRNGPRREHVPALIDGDAKATYGAWVRMDPPASAPPSVDRRWTALDGTPFRDSDVDTRALVTDRHRWFGRMSVQDHTRRRYEAARTYFAKRLLQRYKKTGDGIVDYSDEQIGFVDPAVYVFMAHGMPGA